MSGEVVMCAVLCASFESSFFPFPLTQETFPNEFTSGDGRPGVLLEWSSTSASTEC